MLVSLRYQSAVDCFELAKVASCHELVAVQGHALGSIACSRDVASIVGPHYVQEALLDAGALLTGDV